MNEEGMACLLSKIDRAKVKERMVGKFIGFTWCVTPIEEVEKKTK